MTSMTARDMADNPAAQEAYRAAFAAHTATDATDDSGRSLCTCGKAASFRHRSTVAYAAARKAARA